MNLDIISKQVINLVKGVGFFIQSEAQNLSAGDIELKGYNDFVTYIDKEAEHLSELGGYYCSYREYYEVYDSDRRKFYSYKPNRSK